MKLRSVIALGIVFALSAACQSQEPRAQPQKLGPNNPAMPTGHPPGAGQPGAMGNPLGRPVTGPVPTKLVAKGTISVSEELKAKTPQGVLFITGRPSAQGTKGPPTLVKRIASPKFPIAFELTDRDLMMKGMVVPQELTVQVRLDQDGDAISRMPGDLSGLVEGVKMGAKDLKITLSQRSQNFQPGRRIDP